MTDCTDYTAAEETEAVQLFHGMRAVVTLPAGSARDAARRQLAADVAQLPAHLAHLYRRLPAAQQPRAAAVTELAIGLLYGELPPARVAKNDPHTHVLLLELLAGTDSAAHDAALLFTSPLPADDAFMMLGTD